MICQLQESPSLCDGKEGRARAASENSQVHSIIHSQFCIFFCALFNTASSAAPPQCRKMLDLTFNPGQMRR